MAKSAECAKEILLKHYGQPDKASETINIIKAMLEHSAIEVAKAIPRQKLRDLIDEVWMHVNQSTEVPSTKTADMLIDKIFKTTN